MNLMNRMRALVVDDSGQDLIEYAMLVALIALACVVAVTAAGSKVQSVFESVVSQIPS